MATKRKHLRRIFNYHDVLLRNTEEIDYVWREAPRSNIKVDASSSSQFLLLSRRVNLSLEDGEEGGRERERDNGRSLESAILNFSQFSFTRGLINFQEKRISSRVCLLNLDF